MFLFLIILLTATFNSTFASTTSSTNSNPHNLDPQGLAILEKYDSCYAIGTMAAFNQAIIYAQKLLNYAKTKQDNNIMALAYAKIGLIYDTINDDLDQAIYYYQKSYELYQLADNLPRAGIMQSCVAVILTKQGKYSQAEKHYQKALAIYQEAKKAEPKHWFFTYRRYISLAIVMHNLAQARKLLQKTEEIFRQWPHPPASAAQELLLTKVELLKAEGKFQECIQLLESRNKNIDSQKEYSAKTTTLKQLSELYAKVNNYRKAYDTLLKASEMVAIGLKNSHTRELNAYRAQWEAERKEEIIKTQKLEIETQKNKLLLVTAVGIITILLLLTLAYALYQRKKHQKQLSQQNHELKRLNQELAEALAELQENKEELLSSLITIQKQQETIIETQKIAAIASLSANIAHELNTPLGVILSASQQLQAGQEQIYESLFTLLSILSPAEIKFLQHIALSSESQNKNIKQEREDTRECAQELNLPLSFARKLVSLNLGSQQALDEHQLDKNSPHFESFINLVYNIASKNIALKNIILSINQTRKVIELINWFVQNRKEEASSINLKKVLENTLSQFDAFFKSEKVELSLKIPDTIEVKASSTDIAFIFTQLIQNSIFAMQGEGKLSIKVRAEDRQAIIIVEDNGPGIAPNLQDKIFQPFVTNKSEGQGIGMGLYITQKIIETLDGTISFESREGKTSFTIVLPLAPTTYPSETKLEIPERA
ncbi:MAG: ATP-binding protein [Bacteroidia bacterium]|nr:ATP-binding protein [Bacteroidia bacterium]MDW8159347.1 ATP-binding protein [Bacteroidia bacterium]